MPHIVTIGEILVDMMARDAGQDFRESGCWLGPHPGGAPAVFISQAARLGVSAGIIACVGDDGFGTLCLDRLRADGVDVSAVAVSREYATACAFVAYNENGGRSFIFHLSNTAAGRIDAAAIREDWLADCRCLHIMGTSLGIPGVLEGYEKAARIIRAQGGIISFDPNVRPELIARDPVIKERIFAIYKECDLLLPGEDELAFLTGTADLEESLNAVFRDTRAREVVIKMGSRGCRYASLTERFTVPPFPVEENDPTGAGDSFGGTLIAALALGIGIREAVSLAAAAGALCVTRQGAMEGAGSFPELRDFAREHLPAPA